MAPSEQDHDARPVLVAGVLLRGHEIFRTPLVQTWAAVFVSIVLQALPFLTLGVALSAVIAVYVSCDVLTKVLPSRPVLAVPAAAVAGVVLPRLRVRVGAGAGGGSVAAQGQDRLDQDARALARPRVPQPGAARLPARGRVPAHFVHLDDAIATLRETGADMSDK
ncbi:permease [Lentzea rhizosphaerae]|uniref:Permease n=1 Tax=Lentzea rhizosphaerae TaxID=2041025 RepID=A0ABV8BZ66_9PSEU